MTFLAFLEGQRERRARAKPETSRTSIGLRLRVAGIDDLDQALAQIRALWQKRQQEETMRFIDEVTATARKRFASQARFADGMQMFASQRLDNKDYDTAEPIFRAAIRLYRNEYGDGHPSIATTLRLLGNTLDRKGDSEAAEPVFRESVEMQRHLLGNEHPRLARALYDHAHFLHFRRQQYEQAETLYREALAIQRKVADEKDPLITWTLHNLAQLLDDHAENFDESEALYREALDMRRRLLGGNHTNTASTIQALAELLHDRKQYDEAESLYREALKLREGRRRARSMFQLACLLQEQSRDLDEAEALLRAAIEIFEQTLDDDHEELIEARSELSKLEDDGRKQAPGTSSAEPSAK